MLQFSLRRIYHGAEYTIGRLYVDGEYLCDTLEDPVRNIERDGKIYGATAIPAGTYDVEIGWSPKFRRELPRIKGVPHFVGILIHRGNTPQDTHGCILPGVNTVRGEVRNSTMYEQRIVELIRAADGRAVLEVV